MKMHRQLKTFAALACAAAAPAALAQENLSYTWFEVDYALVDVDYVDDGDFIDDFDDGGGWAVNGSFAFTPNWYGFAGFSKTDADATLVSNGQVFASSSEDVERLVVGVGYALPLNIAAAPNTDLRLQAGYVDIDLGDFDVGATGNQSLSDLGDDESDGWLVDAALRSQLAPWVEGTIGVQYVDIEDAENFALLIGALFEITQNWGVNVEGNIGDEIATYYLGARYSFDWNRRQTR